MQASIRRTGVLLVLALSAQAVPAAELFYMDIAGIPGDVTQPNYVHWISVNSFSTGLSNSQAGAVTGRGVGRLLCQDMHVAKFLDVTSPKLLTAVATGHRYSKIELVAVNTGAEVPNEFLRLTLQNVVISSVTFAGDNATSARVETLVLDPERIEVTYTPQFADGRLGTPMSALADCSN